MKQHPLGSHTRRQLGRCLLDPDEVDRRPDFRLDEGARRRPCLGGEILNQKTDVGRGVCLTPGQRTKEPHPARAVLRRQLLRRGLRPFAQLRRPVGRRLPLGGPGRRVRGASYGPQMSTTGRLSPICPAV